MQVNKVGEQNLFRLFGHFSVAALFFAGTLFASSFEDFKKSQDAAFASYKDKRDAEFKKHLDAEWKEYVAKQTSPFYEKPKPKNIAPTTSKPIKSVGPKIRVIVPKPEPIVVDVEPKPIVVDAKPKPDVKDVNFDFYGSRLGFNIDDSIKEATYFPQNQQGIGKFFDVLATSEYEYLVESIQRVAKDMELNDWGVYLLVNKLGAEIYSNADNRNLFNWFVFNKLGYSVKVGISNRRVITMFYSQKTIYSKSSYLFSGKKYYVMERALSSLSSSVYSYPQEYPNATKALDLSMHKLPKLAQNAKSRDLGFNQYGKKYSVKYSYNQNLIDFMATYPQADYDTYFNAPLEAKTYEDISKELKKHIDGMQASKAINFVLKFVQKAFKYKTDSEQFGLEKVMFAQETLYFESSDCEDRAVLFAYLVKNIFKIGVVGVKYKDHMSTALYIPISGDTVEANGRRFVIADPTYVNANVGQNMPKYRRVKPDNFIVVKNQTD